MIKQFKVLIRGFIPLFKEYFFDFLSNTEILGPKVIKELNSLISNESNEIIKEFEDVFSKKIGFGRTISFASGRMGLYQLLKILNIGEGDEIIINSGTCAVMINAIMHANATPVYSDVDLYTFGSSPEEIKKNINIKTKMIIAQHSFGIPCKIDEIKKLSKKHNIFLLEDCALTLNSSFNRTKVGNFGDAALFSFDHTKPLNLFSGGAIYYRNNELYELLKVSTKSIKSIPLEKQKAMLKRSLLEQRFQNPSKCKFLIIYDFIQSVKNKLGFNSPYLDENSSINNMNCSYPYPAKIPTFIAKQGIYKLKNIDNLFELRKKNLKIILKELQKTSLNESIPKVYLDKKIVIIPLRLVLFNNELNKIKTKFKPFLDVESIWFQKPIISTSMEISLFGYKNNCPNSELVGENIINFPLDYSHDFIEILIKKIKNVIL